jgi:hypothetical protein
MTGELVGVILAAVALTTIAVTYLLGELAYRHNDMPG